jgi:glycosyltransferase involved in cell wall biosynthesis
MSNRNQMIDPHKAKQHIVMLVSHPIQYYVPIYREMAKRGEIRLTVLFRSRVGLGKSFDSGFGREVTWDIPLLDGYEHIFISDKNNLNGIEFGVFGAIHKLKPDVLLVHGYHQYTNILAIFFARLCGVPVLLRSDTRQTAANMNPGRLVGFLKRAIFKVVNGCIAIGTLNRDFYRSNGVPSHKLFFAPFSVNNAFFSLPALERANARMSVRTELGIKDDDFVVLSASKLISIKRIQDIVQAFASLAGKFPQLRLVVVGTGDQEESLRELDRELGLEGIIFAGFKNQSQLPSVYAASDVFVLASEVESWGLAVNEAMAAGLPCVVSNQVGAAPDLVQGKGTGAVYECGDIVQLSKALDNLISNSAYRRECGQRAIELVAKWDTITCADKFVAAGKEVMP